MKIIIRIGGDNSVAMTDEQLETLNQLLAETPTVNTYDDDKINDKERVKLSAKMIVKSSTYKVS